MHLLFLALLLFSSEFSAQLKEFAIKETQPSGSVPVLVNFPGHAAVIIYSSVENISFESNTGGIIEVKSESGKYLLVINAERQFITLKCRGFREEKISIPRLSPRDVRYYTVEAKLVQNQKLPVNFSVTPAGALIYINGKLHGVNTTLDLAPGLYDIRLEKHDFHTLDRKIQVTESDRFFSFTLSRIEPVKVFINSDPSPARIFVNDVASGETPYSGFHFPGNYEITLFRDGYLKRSAKLTVKEGSENQFTLSLEKYSGIVIFEVTPPDASILINRVDHTGKSTVELTPGQYKIELVRESYIPYVVNLSVTRNDTLTVRTDLQPLLGTLVISVNPADAMAELSKNGKLIERWNGSKEFKQLLSGQYSLKVWKSDYGTKELEITVSTDQITQTSVILDRSKTDSVQNRTEWSSDLKIPDMVFVPGGSFQMGSILGQRDETPVRVIRVTDFFISSTEITFDQFDSFCRATKREFPGDNNSGRGNKPVANITWHDAKAYCDWLGKIIGRRIDLPTEAEWEYAARGKSFAFTDDRYVYSGSYDPDEVSWNKENSNNQVKTVAYKLPNDLGLYDMSGNLWEWCRDWYDEAYYYSKIVDNPIGPVSGSEKVLRGGCYNVNYAVKESRVSNRYSRAPDTFSPVIGFRIVAYP